MKKQKKEVKKVGKEGKLSRFIRYIKSGLSPLKYKITVNAAKGVKDMFFSPATHAYVDLDILGSVFSDINLKVFSIYNDSNYFYYIDITTRTKRIALFINGRDAPNLYNTLYKNRLKLSITTKTIHLIEMIILYLELTFSECTLRQNILQEQLSTYTLNYHKKVLASLQNLEKAPEKLSSYKVSVEKGEKRIDTKDAIAAIKSYLKKSYFTLIGSSLFYELFDVEPGLH